jgi:endonuclease/exonuclease/phosphatase family metal-dependent hydrolase
VRLLSYNIHKGIGGRDRRYNLERVCEVILQQKPDLVCLQEVTQHARLTHHHDQPSLLCHWLEVAAHLYQMNVHYREGGYGNLMLSRWPFRRRHQVSLRLGRRKPRGAQMVVVDTAEGPLHLSNVHLGLSEKERHWQVTHLLHHPLFRESCHLPTVVVGDCNDWRNTLAAGPFARHDFEHVTGPPSHFRSFPAFLSMLALDKAFHRGVVIDHALVVRSALTRRASDHLPLVIDFHLANGQHE